MEEHEAHGHGDDCREEEKVLACGKEESKRSTDDTMESETVETAAGTATAKADVQDAEEKAGSGTETAEGLVCGKEAHAHGDGCYEDGCGLEEHTHGDGCYEKTETLTCEAEEHTHGDGCYSDGETVLDCDQESMSTAAAVMMRKAI